ncbi:hypothetical protein HanOQP8_Chr10g0363581 [Helianthus annuus]|nr:hypothetical protein HanOQP8_Chr10g0363581 [Helianthus annuus]
MSTLLLGLPFQQFGYWPIHTDPCKLFFLFFFFLACNWMPTTNAPGYVLLLDPMLSKTQGAGEAPRLKPRHKAQKKRGLF